MKLKKWAAMLLCVILTLQLGGVPSQAAKSVYFTGLEENILPLSDSTMPFWKDNYLYVPASIFSGMNRTAINVGYSKSSDGSWVALYRGDRALLFKLDKNYGEDQDGKRYHPGAVERNGQVFVPAGIITAFFGLKYSVSNVQHGSLAWIRTPNFGLSEDLFTDAASSVMEQRYQEYMDTQDQPEPVVPETPPVLEELISGKRLYVCLRAGERTAEQMDLLDRYDSRMTFFCTPEFMAENHDLLRRMAGTGQGIGILVKEGEGMPPVLEQLEAANRELEQATWEKTRLVRVEDCTPETLTDLLTRGYCAEISTVERSRTTLNSSAQATELLRSMNATRKTAVVWLDDAVVIGSLSVFLSQAARADDPCVPLRETTALH